MNILSISSDRKVFEPGSAVRARLLEYGRLVESMHVIVFARRALGFIDESFPPNIFLYSTNSCGKFFHVIAAIAHAVKLKRQGVGIDIVTTQDPFEAGIAGYFIAWLFGARLHVQIHTDFLSPYFARESALNRVRVCVAKFLIRRAHAIRVVSLRIKESLLKEGVPEYRIAVLPIFIDIKQGDKRTNHGLERYPQFSSRVLMASRLTREKNIESVLRAMVLVLKTNPKVGLIIVGQGPEEARLKKIATELGLSENVLFEGWQDDLSPYYRTADVFVVSSYYEGYGMTVVEALSCGCPVVMTDVGCAGEVVHNEDNGLIIPVDDVSALAHALERVVSGKVKLEAVAPKLITKEEYLAQYKKSWNDALV